MHTELEFPYPHFAFIYIDENGKPQVHESASIAGCGREIFTPNVTDQFMEMASPNGQKPTPYSTSESLCYRFPKHLQEALDTRSSLDMNQIPQSSWNMHENPEWMYPAQRSVELIPCEWQSHQSRRKRRDTKRVGLGMSPLKSSSPPPTPAIGYTILRVDSRELLRRFYAKAFEEFQQLNCRSIAKSYIKLVEPRKQVHFPYNGRTTIAGVPQRVNPEMTKPGWWPAGVVHKEPDHLLKNDRVRLLVHILCELRDSHGITVEKLREASQEARRHITPPNRLEVLDEIYFVRRMEEKYLDGKIGGSKMIQVTKTHLPDAVLGHESFGDDGTSSSVDDGELSVLKQDVPLTPTTSNSSVTHSPANELGTYPMGMMPNALSHGSPVDMRQAAPEQNYFRGYFSQQFAPVDKEAVYWPNVSPSIQYGDARTWKFPNGHSSQLLLEKGAEINAQGGFYGNALNAASSGGHDKIVQLLLEKGAEINAQDGRYGNALNAASLGGHDKIVQLLLEKGAEINAQDGRYRNALNAASLGGHDKIMQVLLEKVEAGNTVQATSLVE
ncbi:hypothetical protein N7470_010098 [Penicillium chermesinum]|nr:hypothetical protein N7470_010098 [Penicillium chermesinum]